MKKKKSNKKQVKWLLLLALLVLLSPLVSAQENNKFLNYDATDVVYRGFENKLNLNVPHDSDSELDVSCVQCTLVEFSTDEQHIYTLKPGTSREATLTIRAKQGGVEKVYEKKYRVANIPVAALYLDGTASDEVLNVKKLRGVLSVKHP